MSVSKTLKRSTCSLKARDLSLWDNNSKEQHLATPRASGCQTLYRDTTMEEGETQAARQEYQRQHEVKQDSLARAMSAGIPRCRIAEG